MRINMELLRWQFRQTLPVTLVSLPLAVLYVLQTGDRLLFRFESLAMVFVMVHCLAIAWRLGRTSLPEFRFLYSQGYSRDALFAHTMLASLLALLAVWVPVGLLIFLPIRSSVQVAAGNPWFPFAAWTERAFVWRWFLASLILLPAFHYAWIRASLARRGVYSGYVLAAATVLVCGILWGNAGGISQTETYWTGTFALLASAVTLLIGGWIVHRRIEVL
ncbi:MAG: hypothetical protein ACKVII_16705 [Planctomycetales bacterium]|jgi:hypothetical protein